MLRLVSKNAGALRVWIKKMTRVKSICESKIVSINQSIEMDAPQSKVWEIVSDVDNDPKYWSGMSEVKNAERKGGNVIERVVKVGFMGHEGHQIIKLHPKESVELVMTKGPLKGSRNIKLIPIQDRKTMVEVAWDFEFSGVPSFARAFVKSQLERVTDEALSKIAREAKRQSAIAKKKDVPLSSV